MNNFVSTICAILFLTIGHGTALSADTAAEKLLRDLMSMNGKINLEAELEYIRRNKIVDHILEGEIEATAMARSFEPAKLADAADKVRDSGVVMENGELAVTMFYEAVQKFATAGGIALQLFESAAAAKPESSSARLLAMSVALTNIAETARIPLLVEYDGDVAPHDPVALAKLRKDLEASKELLAREPYWYNLRAEVMTIQQGNPADVLGVVHEGLEAFPQNTRLVVIASNRFLPRWGGDANRLLNYLEFVGALPAVRDRSDMYARVYWNALNLEYKLTLFKIVEKDWDRMGPALDTLVKAYPTTLNVNIAAMMACLGGDRAKTRSFLQHAKFKPMQQLWKDPDALPLCFSWAG